MGKMNNDDLATPIWIWASGECQQMLEVLSKLHSTEVHYIVPKLSF